MKILKNKKLKPSSKAWMLRHINDQYVHKAKSLKYRSRAAFKLLEIDEKFKILKSKCNVAELGSAPGGWSQVIVEKCKKSKILCVDLLSMAPIDGVHFIVGDFCQESVIEKIIRFFCDTSVISSEVCHENIIQVKDVFDDTLNNNMNCEHDNCATQSIFNGSNQDSNQIIDLLLSDIAPSMTGNKSVDFSRINMIANIVVNFAEKHLKMGGNLILKYFHTGSNELITRLRKMFSNVKVFKPESSRAESAEVYMICIGKKF